MKPGLFGSTHRCGGRAPVLSHHRRRHTRERQRCTRVDLTHFRQQSSDPGHPAPGVDLAGKPATCGKPATSGHCGALTRQRGQFDRPEKSQKEARGGSALASIPLFLAAFPGAEFLEVSKGGRFPLRALREIPGKAGVVFYGWQQRGSARCDCASPRLAVQALSMAVAGLLLFALGRVVFEQLVAAL